MSESVYVVVSGHHQEAKCDVASALLQESDHFKPFSCTENIEVKSLNTFMGKQLFIVATPALDTPAWTHSKKSIKEFETKVFLYVKVNDYVDSDDRASAEYLEREFGGFANSDDQACTENLEREIGEQRTQVVLTVGYNLGKRGSGAATTDSMPFRQDPMENIIVFNRKDTFQMKIETAETVFRDIVKILETPTRPTVTSHGDEMSVDDKTRPKDAKSVDTKSDTSDMEVTIYPRKYSDSEQRSLWPELCEDDWTLYRRTLKYGKAKTNHIRVNIVGNQGAGKTTLVKRLQEVEVECPDRTQRATEILAINEINIKCTEKDGKRVWEHSPEGYEDESNIQRMSFALKSVKEKSKDEVEQQNTNICCELEMGSEEYEEHLEKSNQYVTHVNNKQKEMYLQQVKKWLSNQCEDERMYISYWDFAGQATYYSTHQAFLAPSSVYVLVINLSQDLKSDLKDSLTFRTSAGILRKYTVEETVKFWISSIKAYTRDEKGGTAPFIVVGTHKDKVTEDEIKEKFEHLRSVMKGVSPLEFVAIDNTQPMQCNEALQDLRNKILDEGLGVIDGQIPAQWIELESSLMREKERGKTVMKFSDLEEMDNKSDMPMKDPERLMDFLDYQHSRGLLLHYCHTSLKDLIILDPSLLAEFFNTLLRDNQSLRSYNKNGVIHQYFLDEAIARVFPVSQGSPEAQTYTKLLLELHIMHRYKDGKYFVPSLLPHRDLEQIDKENANKEHPTVTLKLSFKDAFVPPAFYHLLVSALNENSTLTMCRTEGDHKMYNLYVCFEYHSDTCLLEMYWNECSVFFKLTNYSHSYKLVDAESNKIEELLNMIQERVNHVLTVYRQVNTKFTLQAECPEHRGRYIDLAKAKRFGEAMCLHKSPGHHRHAVCWSDIVQSVSSEPNDSSRKTKTTEKLLGRLARQLSEENVRSMTSKLGISDTIADQAAEEFKNPAVQRLYILTEWMKEFPDVSLEQLLLKFSGYGNKISVRQLTKDISPSKEPTPHASFEHPVSEHELIRISDCVNADYPFLMLELDMSFTDIARCREENTHLRDIVFNLLKCWQQQNAEKATLRNLLSVADHLSMGINNMIRNLMR